ncbi:MnhB domain-containing protein [Nocardiopsis gilva]|uniref:MnhB domain-containing protein n=1 Tax=Nocardiopsis gilva TaxID=280236 RepID=UPI001E2D4947|nr:MnhB domain-containing protein [Nocardiopsis gilva]
MFLLVSGHDRPGGGFAAGLVAGMAYVLRYIAGGRRELAAGLPMRPQGLLAIGLLVAAGTATLPLLWGAPILQTFAGTADLPVFGR